MKINSLTSAQISKYNSFNTKQSFKTSSLSNDKFEKSNLSFGARDIHYTNVTDTHGYQPFEIYSTQEALIGDILYLMEDPNYWLKLILYPQKQESLETYFSNVYRRMFEMDYEYAASLFKNANIKTVEDYTNFLGFYITNDKTVETFRHQPVALLKTCEVIEDRKDIHKFPQLLLHLVDKELDSDNPDYSKLNKTINFLKANGVDSFEKFNGTFGYLKPYFNEFADNSDRYTAIEFLVETDEERRAMFDEVLKQAPDITLKNPQKTYQQSTEFITYFYLLNNGKSLDGLSDILEYVTQSKKIPYSLIKQHMNFDKDTNPTEEKVAFYNFLKECKIPVADVSRLLAPNQIEGIDPLDILINREDILNLISTARPNVSQEKNSAFYCDFKGPLNAVHDIHGNDVSGINTLIEIIDRYKLKNNNAFLEFYKTVTGNKSTKISAVKIKEFVELFKYSDSPNIINDAKSRKTLGIKLLTAEKEKFLSVKDAIEEFINNDENAYFVGQTSLSIYKKYKDIILGSRNKDLSAVLSNIATLNPKSKQEFQIKSETISKFSKYFANRQNMLSFFVNNNIHFDDSAKENTLIRNCMTIFSTLEDENNPEEAQKRIDYFTQSGFISKSNSKLSTLLTLLPTKELRKEVLSLIADKEIPSLDKMENFFKQYGTKESTGRELLLYLQTLPQNVNFAQIEQTLHYIQKKILSLRIPVVINADNIGVINPENYPINSELTSAKYTELLNGLYGTSEKNNFFFAMSPTTNNQFEKLNKKIIAQEIVKQVDKTDESYKNITRLLKLDRESLGLNEKNSLIEYSKAMQKAIPQEFVNFVKSDNWDIGGNVPEFTLHARLRAIDRFVLEGMTSIDELYTDEAKKKLSDLFDTVYKSTPTIIKGSKTAQVIIADFNHNGREIETVFDPHGKMITIVPKRKTA